MMTKPPDQTTLFAERDSTAKPKAKAKAAKTDIVAFEPPPPPSSMLAVIARAAADPAVQPDKMRALLDMQERIEASEAKNAFTRAFNALQFELPTIDKDGFIDHGEGTTAKGNKKLKARYSTYPNLMSVCRPLLRKHGFTFNNTIEPGPDGTRIVVVGYLTHVSGHGMTSNFPLSADGGPGRSNAQAWGSASSYGKRYNLILLLDIVSEAPQDRDDDDRRAGAAKPIVTIDDEKTRLLVCAIDFCGVGTDRFCAKYGIEKVSDLPASLFNEALRACQNYSKTSHDQKDNTSAT